MSVDAGLEAAEVRVAITGAIYSNDAASPVVPTSASGTLDSGFVGHGYSSSDGVTETTSVSTQKIRAWQNNALVREVVTEGDATYKTTLIQTTAENVGLYYGDTVDTTDGSVRVRPGVAKGRRAFVIDVIDGSNIIRTVIPSGEVTATGDQVYVASGVVGYPVTITAYADADGVSATKFYSELVVPPAWTASTAYTLGQKVTLSGGAVLEVTTAGTSGTTEPVAPASVGGTVVNGTVTFTRVS